MSKKFDISDASYMAKTLVRKRKKSGASFPENAIVELTKFITNLPTDNWDDFTERLTNKVKKLEKNQFIMLRLDVDYMK